MIKRKLVTLSMPPEDEELLKSIAAEVGLNKSELVRRMLYKISFDDKMKAIIKRGQVITSNNVHYGNEQKKAENIEKNKNPGHDSREDSSSLDPTNNLPQLIQIAKYDWVHQQ